MGHAREEERQHEEVSQTDEVETEEETPSKTRFTNQGQIPAVQNAAAAQAPTASERAYGSLTVTARGLNVRSGPSTNDRVLGMLRRGEQVQELGRTNGWVQISFGGQTAFVHSHYVSAGGHEAKGHAPSAEAQAEAMDMFREVNGEQGRGHAPSKQAQAEAMDMFREVNGPAKSEPQKRSLDEITADLEVGPAAAPTTAGPQKRNLDEIVADVEGPASAPAQGHAPSKEGQAEAMRLFREVNGEPAAHAPNKAKLDEIAADLE